MPGEMDISLIEADGVRFTSKEGDRMITLVRLESEAYELADVIKDLDAAETAIRALQDGKYPVLPLNIAVEDEHYERCKSKGDASPSGDTSYFKGRRVLRFIGRAAWDDNSDLDKPQPRSKPWVPGGTSMTATASSTPYFEFDIQGNA